MKRFNVLLTAAFCAAAALAFTPPPAADDPYALSADVDATNAYFEAELAARPTTNDLTEIPDYDSVWTNAMAAGANFAIRYSDGGYLGFDDWHVALSNMIDNTILYVRGANQVTPSFYGSLSTSELDGLSNLTFYGGGEASLSTTVSGSALIDGEAGAGFNFSGVDGITLIGLDFVPTIASSYTETPTVHGVVIGKADNVRIEDCEIGAVVNASMRSGVRALYINTSNNNAWVSNSRILLDDDGFLNSAEIIGNGTVGSINFDGCDFAHRNADTFATVNGSIRFGKNCRINEPLPFNGFGPQLAAIPLAENGSLDSFAGKYTSDALGYQLAEGANDTSLVKYPGIIVSTNYSSYCHGVYGLFTDIPTNYSGTIWLDNWAGVAIDHRPVFNLDGCVIDFRGDPIRKSTITMDISTVQGLSLYGTGHDATFVFRDIIFSSSQPALQGLVQTSAYSGTNETVSFDNCVFEFTGAPTTTRMFYGPDVVPDIRNCEIKSDDADFPFVDNNGAGSLFVDNLIMTTNGAIWKVKSTHVPEAF